MNRLLHLGRVPALAVLLAALPLGGWASTPQTTLPPDAIVAKAVERAESLRSNAARPAYLYTKHTVTEDLDNKGRVKDRKEKLYEISVEAGFTYPKLLQLNG